MINLIPPEAERVVKREYMLRVGGTMLFLFGVVALLLTVTLIPTYVLIEAQMHAGIRAATAGDEYERFKEADNEVQKAEYVVRQLSKGKVAFLPSEAIATVESLANPGINFKTFTITDTNGAITQMSVQGIATSREVLASFRNALEASSYFKSAEVPISDLARDNNLPFTITIIPEAIKPTP